MLQLPEWSFRISIFDAPAGGVKIKSESAIRSVKSQSMMNAVNSGWPGSFLWVMTNQYKLEKNFRFDFAFIVAKKNQKPQL